MSKSKKRKRSECLICTKNTMVKTGWHTKNGLDFCSNHCVSEYLESLCDTAFMRIAQ